jgi:hypothetical protein
VDGLADEGRALTSGLLNHAGTGAKRLPWAAARPLLFTLLVVAAACGAYLFKLRDDGIFACPAGGYGADQYLAYCHANEYGDYEHGAFWFGLEPAATRAAGNADLLFLGDSHLQFALSTSATADWFAAAKLRYYLLGFGYGEDVGFTGRLLGRLRPRARIYVINVDGFFDRSETVAAKAATGDWASFFHFQGKRWWQELHRPVCGAVPQLCGQSYVIYRSRATGAYHAMGEGAFVGRPVAADDSVDMGAVTSALALGHEFLSTASIDHRCVLLTIVPNGATKSETAALIAKGLGRELIAPKVEGLETFDGIHLDAASAERWSAAFLRAAAPEIERCRREAGHAAS